MWLELFARACEPPLSFYALVLTLLCIGLSVLRANQIFWLSIRSHSSIIFIADTHNCVCVRNWKRERESESERVCNKYIHLLSLLLILLFLLLVNSSWQLLSFVRNTFAKWLQIGSTLKATNNKWGEAIWHSDVKSMRKGYFIWCFCRQCMGLCFCCCQQISVVFYFSSFCWLCGLANMGISVFRPGFG